MNMSDVKRNKHNNNNNDDSNADLKSRTLRYINFGGATFEWIDTTSVMMI